MESTLTPQYATARWQQRLLPSIEGIVVIFIFLMVLLLGDHLLGDPDTAWHIRTGDYILTQMEVPQTDIFSHRKLGQVWVAHEWLADVIFACVHRMAGLNGIVVFSALVIATTFILLFRLIARYSFNILITSAVTVLSAITTSIHWLARPHLLSMCLTVMWYSALDSHQREPRRYHFFLFPGLIVLWVNLHGSFLLAFALVGIYALGNLCAWLTSDADTGSWRRKFVSLLLIGTLCVVASLVNPYGVRVLLFPLEVLNANQAMSTISEWQSPDFHHFGSFELYLLLLVFILLITRTKTTCTEVCLIIFSLHIALVGARYIPLFAVLMAPVLARRLEDGYGTFLRCSFSSRYGQGLQRHVVKFADRAASFNSNLRSQVVPVTVAAIITAVALNGGVLFGNHLLAYEFRGTPYPVRAVEFLKQNIPSGNMFNYYSYGGYLIYKFFPDPRYRVYVDGRAIVGGTDYFTDYLDVVNLTTRWKQLLKRDKVNWVLYPANEGFSMALLESAEWKLIYTDGQASIFVRNLPQNQPIISRFSVAQSHQSVAFLP